MSAYVRTKVDSSDLRSFFPHLSSLDVEHVDVVSSRVHNRPEQHAVRDLAMEPYILVEWNAGCRHQKPNEPNDVAQNCARKR